MLGDCGFGWGFGDCEFVILDCAADDVSLVGSLSLL